MLNHYFVHKVSVFYGSAPHEGKSCIQISLMCNLPVAENYLILKSILHLMNGGRGIGVVQQKWLNELRLIESTRVDENPLIFLWRSLQLAFGYLDYPLYVVNIIKCNGSVLVDLKCYFPYHDFFMRVIKLLLSLLNVSVEIASRKSNEINFKWLAHWSKEFDQLIDLLPHIPIRIFHYKLWKECIAWDWLGNEKTRIGFGVNQRVYTGAPEHKQFNDPATWSIPIYTITGSVGKTTTTRLLWQMLGNTGKTLALAVSDGAWIGSKKVSDGDCIGGRSAKVLLQSPAVECAVFEQGRGGLIKQGVPYAQSDIAILLNVQAVHLGLDGIHTLEEMADVKVAGLRPARIWVLNHDDAQCRRISVQHASKDTVWFSVTCNLAAAQSLSNYSLGVLCIVRDKHGAPIGLCILQNGQEIKQLDLAGVAPYHGMLGEKTLEELLAAVAAAWFGPLSVHDFQTRLSELRLDSNNHAFRTSIHRQGQVIFVLDKAAELASLESLKQVMKELAEREGCLHSIAVLTRSAGETPERHLESAQVLHSFMDEFICFDRQETYKTSHALPIYRPGSIPRLLKNHFEKLNEQMNVTKPVLIAEDWAAVQNYLYKKLSGIQNKTLVLINQPATGLTELNQQILSFANTGLNLSRS